MMNHEVMQDRNEHFPMYEQENAHWCYNNHYDMWGINNVHICFANVHLQNVSITLSWPNEVLTCSLINSETLNDLIYDAMTLLCFIGSHKNQKVLLNCFRTTLEFSGCSREPRFSFRLTIKKTWISIIPCVIKCHPVSGSAVSWVQLIKGQFTEIRHY